MSTIKPGAYSSEFWLTLGAALVGLAGAYLGWDASKTDEVNKSVTALITGAASLVASLALVWKYVHGREQLKGVEIMSQGMMPKQDQQGDEEQEDEEPRAFGFAPKHLQENGYPYQDDDEDE